MYGKLCLGMIGCAGHKRQDHHILTLTVRRQSLNNDGRNHAPSHLQTSHRALVLRPYLDPHHHVAYGTTGNTAKQEKQDPRMSVTDVFHQPATAQELDVVRLPVQNTLLSIFCVTLWCKEECTRKETKAHSSCETDSPRRH